MKKNKPLLFVILSCILFICAFKTATKNLGSRTILTGDRVNTINYTPFNYSKYEEVNTLFNTFGIDNGFSDKLKEEAKFYSNITFILILGGIFSIFYGAELFFKKRKIQNESIKNQNMDEILKV